MAADQGRRLVSQSVAGLVKFGSKYLMFSVAIKVKL